MSHPHIADPNVLVWDEVEVEAQCRDRRLGFIASENHTPSEVMTRAQ